MKRRKNIISRAMESMKYSWKAISLEQAKDWKGLVDCCQEWLKSSPEEHEAWQSLGLAYGKLNRYDDTIGACREAVRIEPRDVKTWKNLGLAYYERGRYDDAIEAYREAVGIKPKDAEAWFKLGLAYRKIKRYDEAIEAYWKVAHIKPRDAEVRFELGLAYDDAIEAYREAVGIKPKDAEAWLQLGLDYGDATEAYWKAVRIYPEDSKVWNNLGNAYRNLKHHQDAVVAYREATRINPEYIYAWDNLGIAYRNLKDHHGALVAGCRNTTIREKQDREAVQEVKPQEKPPANQIKPQPARPNPSLGFQDFAKPTMTTQEASGTFAPSSGKHPQTGGQKIDDQLYEQAWDEVQSANTIKAVWAKAFAECDGDLEKTKARYISQRVIDLAQQTENCEGLEEDRLAEMCQSQEASNQEEMERIRKTEIARDGPFIAYSNGTVLDTRSNLMWAAKDNKKHINWENAASYCNDYRGGDYSDWRMPTLDELAVLYDRCKSYESTQAICDVYLTRLIELSTGWVWASETSGPEGAYFGFSYGCHYWISKSGDLGYRALPVRSVK